MSLEESLSRLEAEIDALIASRDRGGDDDFQKGLTQGLLLALLMLQEQASRGREPGSAPASPRRRGSKAKSMPESDQIDLFKP